MKVLILGAGAVGSYVGAMLALGGSQVSFAVRPAKGAALRADGLRVAGPRGDWRFRDIGVLTDPTQAISEHFDIALSCAKLYDATSSAREWSRTLQHCGAVISLQNGIDGRERVAAGSEHASVYGGLAYVAAELDADGVVRYQSEMSSIVFGGAGASTDPLLGAFVIAADAAERSAPFRARCVDDITTAQWQKLSALATNAALTCLVRRPAGIVYGDTDLLALARMSVDEISAVGRACGARLPAGHAETTMSMLGGLPPAMYASMHHDLAAGRPLELDGLSGAVVRLGRVHGVPTPFHSMAYACLKPYLQGSDPTMMPS